MRLLVTGANGQVGHELVRRGGAYVVGLDRAALDVTDREAVRRAVAEHAPDVVANAAAYTAVDRAESDEAAAFAVNRDGPAYLAAACAEAGIPLIHLSTDYVFDGTKGAPYVETDPVSPLGAYGRSKAAGEEAVRERLGPHVILRTSWVFGGHGPNFVRTMLRLMAERDELRVVADQRGNPTAAADIARAVLQVGERMEEGATAWGTFHFAGQPDTTWHGFAEAILEEVRRHGPVRAERVEPIPTSAYPTPAARPADARLGGTKISEAWGIAPPDWRPALRTVVSSLLTRSPAP